MFKLEHHTLNDRAYAALKQGLITGDFKPGQAMVIRTLAETFGISTTPIREALQRLIAERILEIQVNRTIAVPLLSLATFTELARIRCAVEGLAGELAAKSFDEQDLAKLRERVAGMDAAIQSNDGRQYLALNEQFHFQIYEKANAPILLDMIKDLWGRIGPYMNYLMETDAYIPQSNDLHRQLLTALENRTENLVRLLIVEDISKAADVLSRRLLASQ
jgi:DNA-binding GntR family transcriptional regulator